MIYAPVEILVNACVHFHVTSYLTHQTRRQPEYTWYRTVALSNSVYISAFVVSNTNCNACMRYCPWIRFCSQLQYALTLVKQVIRKMLILSRNQCRYIYLFHKLEYCYLKYRLPIHLLNIMVLKVEKSEKNCQNLMCSVDKIIDGNSMCCDLCTCWDSCQRVCTLSCYVIFNSWNTTATRIHMVSYSSVD